MTTQLYLIRHGEAVANVEPIIGGMRGDAGLTDCGREQADLLEQRLRRGVSCAPTSSMPAHYPGPGRPPAMWRGRCGFRCNPRRTSTKPRPGDADGMTVDQWRDRYGGVDPPPPRRDPFCPFSPGGESWAAFLVRAGAALITLLRSPPRRDHRRRVPRRHRGSLLFYLAFGLGSTGNRVSFAALNTGITHWRHDRDPGGRRDWTIVTFNDAGHLDAARTGTESPHDAVPTPAGETRLM